MRKLAFFLFLILVASGCRQPKDLVFKNVENFGLKEVGRHTKVSLDVHLYNPNPYKMKLKHADLELFLNGRHAGNIQVPVRVSVPKRDTFFLPVAMEIDLKNVLPNLFQLISSSKVDVKLTGKIKAGKYGVFINVPISYEGKQDIREGLKW